MALTTRRIALVCLTPRPDADELGALQLPSYGIRRIQAAVVSDPENPGCRVTLIDLKREDVAAYVRDILALGETAVLHRDKTSQARFAASVVLPPPSIAEVTMMTCVVLSLADCEVLQHGRCHGSSAAGTPTVGGRLRAIEISESFAHRSGKWRPRRKRLDEFRRIVHEKQYVRANICHCADEGWGQLGRIPPDPSIAYRASFSACGGK